MRTKKSIFNFVADVFPFFIMGFLNFIRVKYIIKYYGTDANGYMQLISQIFSYLALAEAGFGTAVIYKLYKPLANKDKESISSIVNGSKIIFKKIALVMSIGSIICTIAIPFFVNKGNLNNTFLILIFILYSVNYLIEYFVVYPYTSLLQADQNQYVFTSYRNVVKIAFGVVELLLMRCKVSLILLILLNIIFTLFYILRVTSKIKKMYPWLDKEAKPDTSAFKMTKDVMVHKFSSLVFSKTDPIILSNFSLGYVTLYTSYNYILDFITSIVSKIFNAIKSSYCNIVALEKKEDKKYYNMFLSFSFFAGTFCACVFDATVKPFVKIVWLGKSYFLSTIIVHMFSIIMFGRIIINPIYVARDSKGLYKETKGFTVAQAIVNIVLSLILVQKYKILGVLIGTVVSQYLVLIPLNVKIVYEKIFNGDIKIFLKKLCISIISIAILFFINYKLQVIFSIKTKLDVIIYMLIIAFVDVIISLIFFTVIDNDFKELVKQIKSKVRRSK